MADGKPRAPLGSTGERAPQAFFILNLFSWVFNEAA